MFLKNADNEKVIDNGRTIFSPESQLDQIKFQCTNCVRNTKEGELYSNLNFLDIREESPDLSRINYLVDLLDMD